jgi:putative CocE/NonD family hydrolase
MIRILSAALLVSCALAASPQALAREAEFEVVVERSLMVPLRDGVKLATDLYRPARDGRAVDGKFPAILTRTPYNKDGNRSLGEFYAARGYVFVAQDTRGRYGSEGEWHWLSDDGPDGVDCVEWIAKQPWSDGQVGMIGTSYVGGTQHAVAIEGSPHLKTIIPVDAVCNMGHASMRNGGAFEMRFWNWIFLNAGRGSRAVQDEGSKAILEELANQRHAYLALLPLRRGTTPLKLAPEYEEWLVSAMEHGANDEFWAQNNIIDHPERYSDIPVYLVGGWYDSWASNTADTYVALSGRLKSPVHLIMGPWIHGAQGDSKHGQVDFGAEAAIADPLAWRLEWYDHFLKGMENSVGTAAPFETRVRLFVMGTGDGHKTDEGKLFHGGAWRNEEEWPLDRARPTSFYLHGDGSLATEKPGADGGATDFVFDPRDPVPTIGGNISSGNDILLQGAWDQKGGEHVWNWPLPIPLSARNDVLVFQSAPLEEDMEVTGPIEVELWASSSAVDTDFTAKLIDVYPPSEDFPGGFDLNITDGIRRARFRESLETETLMTPGEVCRIPVRLYPTSNVFKRGHRIRIDVSSSNFPRFDVNPNTGEPLNRQRRMVTAVNTVLHDADHPSRVILPLVPRE